MTLASRVGSRSYTPFQSWERRRLARRRRASLVLPWPETCVDDATASHCLLLGRAMDHTVARNSSLHKIANSWVTWGGKSLSAICSVWATAVDTA